MGKEIQIFDKVGHKNNQDIEKYLKSIEGKFKHSDQLEKVNDVAS